MRATRLQITQWVQDLDIDAKWPSVFGDCPFCEGSYCAGYRKLLAGQSEPKGTIQHTHPACDTFLRNPKEFLGKARLAGAERRSIADLLT